MKLRRRAVSLLLTMAMVFTFMPFMTQTANAASSSKAPLVTKAVDDWGTTVKYSYNKKGLVKKAVATSSSSEPDTDESKKETTTYKYNKKNKVTTEATTAVTTSTSYKTDKTSGKVRGASTGTEVYKDKSVTKYTYNKKGLATKSVTTTTRTKSGSTTSTSTRLQIPNTYYVIKLNDGRYRYWDDVAEEYKYITDAEAAAYATTTTLSTAYTENADGSYTKTEDGGTPTTYKSQRVTTSSYKYKKQNVKTATTSIIETEESSYTSSSGVKYFYSKITTYSPYVTSFKYKKGRVVKASTSDPNTFSYVEIDRRTYPSGTVYEDRTERANGEVVTTEFINGVPDGEPYKYTYTEDKPITSSATYKYDKNGNLKSSKGKSTSSEEKQQQDEVYGNVDGVYFINAQGHPEELMTQVNTVRSWKETVTNTVKKGTKRLLAKLGMSKDYKDGYPVGETKGAYVMSQTKFKLKTKKVAKKAAKNVESQQWMIQNGVFQTVGL